MIAYTIRDIDDALWKKVKVQAAKDGKPIRTVILELLTKYGGKAGLILAASLLVTSTVRAADKIDPRLATVRKAFVVPVDDLGDDRGAATCLADRLSTKTPIASVATKDDADVIFRIKANIPSATSRAMLGALGGSPSINLEAQLPDGTKLWADGAKARRGNVGDAVLVRGEHVNPIACALADEMIDGLLQAMKKARDAKK